MRHINKVVVHYTDSPDVPIYIVKQWHIARGFNDVGYHLLVRKDGIIEQGRPELEVGAHTAGFNKDSLGVALTGSNRDNWYPTDEQLESLRKVLSDWKREYNISNVYFHRDLNSTSCPGRLRKEQLQDMEDEDMLSFVEPTYEDQGVRKYGGLYTGLNHPGVEEYRGAVWLHLNVLKNQPLTTINFHLIKKDGSKISRSRKLKDGASESIPLNTYLDEGSFRLVVTTPNDEPFDSTVKQFFVKG